MVAPMVLVVDDDESARRRLGLMLDDLIASGEIGFLEATTIPDAFDILASTPVHVVLLDKNLGANEQDARENGILAIPEMKTIRPEVQILMVSGSRTTADIVQAIKLGAVNYVPKETPNELLREQIRIAIGQAELHLQQERMARARSQSGEGIPLLGTSKAIEVIRYQAERFAESDLPVLLLGESGTGKTMIAREIHKFRAKGRSSVPFLEFSLASLNPQTISSELFGHEKGAFTGAAQQKRGFVELANNGTLFLDEIADICPDTQSLLLKVLDNGEYRRMGNSRVMQSNFKLICATHKDLAGLMREGKFRHDLYMRLTTFTLTVPSLRERPEDVPFIIQTRLPLLCALNKVFVDELPADFIEWITNNVPDGNVRGIDAVISNLLVLAPRDSKGNPQLRNWKTVLKEATSNSAPPLLKSSLASRDLLELPIHIFDGKFPGLGELTESVERRVFEECSRYFSQKNADIARFLGISEASVSMKMRKYGLKRERSIGAATHEVSP